MSRPLLLAWLDRLVRLPTAVHLWCAERELRAADVGAMPARLRLARRRNLARLRRYRRRGEFPQVAAGRPRPCFVDAAGRPCAVAYLMARSGDSEAVARVAEGANFARVREMPGPLLAAWARDSGLTTAELARIQPMYPPGPAAVERYVQIVATVGFVGAFAASSILFNLGRLAFTVRPRITTIGLGFLSGLFLIAYGLLADVRELKRTHLHDKTRSCLNTGSALGLVCVASAWITWQTVRDERRTRVGPSAGSGPPPERT